MNHAIDNNVGTFPAGDGLARWAAIRVYESLRHSIELSGETRLPHRASEYEDFLSNIRPRIRMKLLTSNSQGKVHYSVFRWTKNTDLDLVVCHTPDGTLIEVGFLLYADILSLLRPKMEKAELEAV